VPCTPEKREELNDVEGKKYIAISLHLTLKPFKDIHPDPPSAEPPLSDDDAPPLRPLTSLRWPYVPEESAYPDPLKRDDPKPLQTPQYEAIGPSPPF
jgi:hypothetical protein